MTALHASSEEVAEWIKSNDSEKRLQQSQEATSSGSNNAGDSSNAKPASHGEKTKYPFICECFFMTARVFNLGLLKAFSDFKHLVQVIKCVVFG